MSAPTAAEIFKQLPSSLLDSQVSEVHIAKLATEIVQWEEFVPFFGLSSAQEEEIRRDNEGRYGLQKRAALLKWREMKGKDATYRQLIIVFCCLRKNALAENVQRLLLPQSKEQNASVNILDTFRSYLVDCYAQTPHPSRARWPFSRTTSYVDLPLFEVPLSEPDSGSQEELPSLKAVELDKIFLTGCHKAKRKVILLEGVAGSGKTTLTWHACQKWAEGKIFQQFPLLIRVSLEDPAIRSASCIADIIPHPSSETREAVAKAIAERHGKGVCFLLDGLDEAHPQLQEFIHSFLSGKSGRTMLPRCSIIVTSRPVASGSLYSLLTSRVVVGRLDEASVDDLLSAYLSLKDCEVLQKYLEQNPRLANLCNLPINTAIVAHLFQCGHRSLPNTRTGLFKALVRNLVFRHIQLRTSHNVQEIGEEFEFEDLPAKIVEEFTSLSSLAFQGIRQKTRVFSTGNLKGVGLKFPFDSLSLIEAHLTSFGFCRSFMFLHYSVQEFLAAWHMTRLGSEEQAKAVSDFLHSSPLSPVLPFFAGLTRLSNPSVRDVLLEVTKHPLDKFSIMSNKPRTASEDRRRLALALLNCIYEAQDPSLCRLVKPATKTFGGILEDLEGNISFQALGLESGDCLSVGYFMAHHSSCSVDLAECLISEPGVEALLKQLNTTPVSAPSVGLDLSANLLTSHSMKLVSTTVMAPSRLREISLKGSWQPSQVATNLMYLINGLCRRSSPIDVTIAACNITTDHIHLLVLLITSCHCIHRLGLSLNDIGGKMSLIVKALESNTTMITLFLDGCNIGDDSLMDLAEVLQRHSSIRSVTLSSNPLSPGAVVSFLKSHFLSRLQFLELGRPLDEEEKHVYNQLRIFRATRSMPTLTIDAMSQQLKKHGEIADEELRSIPPHVLCRAFSSKFD